ncbi:MAG TPA: NAD(P)/FAD-dependent oxidoreductase [Bacillota bacterium]|jgi:glycerol-3-phosphate dehydrogenase|nr:NAD(P)/FAD-dependent oxidoreductase [Fastidiosipila sp.]HPX93046.1 NAD(P)/FAD-dependent oxidoreductase [Bacillota bacterium]HQB80881.1 NAD(P)/FAD-dependent oxidoreductase [Bacillota bacterium]
MYDLAIIGAGVVGCALAYELSSRDLSLVLIEKENDVAMGASRANTAIIHAGFDPAPETLMGQLNVEGMRRCYDLCEELDVEHRKTGSLVVAFDQEQQRTLDVLYRQGIVNGCQGLEIIDGAEARRREPNLSPEIIAALWAPEAGVINPWEFALAMAEVAVRNGVVFMPNTEVVGLEWRGDHYQITAPSLTEPIRSRYLVNAAGVNSDLIHEMAAEPAFQITPTRGEYYLLDRTVGTLVQSIIFHSPTEQGKGVTVSPTIHNNFLIGPNSEVIEDRADTGVTRSGLSHIGEVALRMVPSLDLRSNIRNFAGVRANSPENDFYIKMSAANFLDLAAIKSPGLTCAPAIARLGADLLEKTGLPMKKKTHWQGGRRVIRFKEIPEEKRAAFIRDNPLYGRVICRCETITEGEIMAAMQREIPPVSIDGVKRRAGTGMGRCQGGFCGPRILEILARETKRSPLSIEEDGSGSLILTSETKKGCDRG